MEPLGLAEVDPFKQRRQLGVGEGEGGPREGRDAEASLAELLVGDDKTSMFKPENFEVGAVAVVEDPDPVERFTVEKFADNAAESCMGEVKVDGGCGEVDVEPGADSQHRTRTRVRSSAGSKPCGTCTRTAPMSRRKGGGARRCPWPRSASAFRLGGAVSCTTTGTKVGTVLLRRRSHHAKVAGWSW